MERYNDIYKHYEKQLFKHGANHMGMDWPNANDLNKRFTVMTGLFNNYKLKRPRILDLGCGVGLYIDYLKKNNLFDKLSFSGTDISSKMIETAKKIHPNENLFVQDIIKKPLPENMYDFILMNGVLTEKVSLSKIEMVEFAKNIILSAFNSSSKGIAFNVMSSYVDWERDDLFHWDLNEVVSYLYNKCSRHIKINMDYGLYEYTFYVYKNSNY
jgi:SAM-dependent methyltransferase